MYFLNRRFSSMWLLAVVLIGIFLVINFLPFILLTIGIVLAVRYVYKYIKNWNTSSASKVKTKNNYDDNRKEEDNSSQYNNSNVIDVEYTEIK